MNIVSKKSLMGLVLAGLVIVSAPIKGAMPVLNTPQKALAAFVVLSLLVTSCKEAVANPEGVDAKDAKRLVQIQDILTSDYWTNIYHLFVDGWLGQVGKNEAILAIANDDGTVTHIATKPKPSTGVCGTVLFWAKAISKKSEDVVKLFALPVLWNNLWKDTEKVAEGKFDEVSVVAAKAK